MLQLLTYCGGTTTGASPTNTFLVFDRHGPSVHCVLRRGRRRWRKLRGFLLGNAIGIEVDSLVKIDHNHLLFCSGIRLSSSTYTNEVVILLLDDDNVLNTDSSTNLRVYSELLTPLN